MIQQEISQYNNPRSFWWGFFKDMQSFKLNSEKIQQATQKALSWKHCAVSEQCDTIPRHPKTKIPKSMYLANLGHKFADEILKGHFITAQKTFLQIELFSCALVLRQLNDEANNKV